MGVCDGRKRNRLEPRTVSFGLRLSATGRAAHDSRGLGVDESLASVAGIL